MPHLLLRNIGWHSRFKTAIPRNHSNIGSFFVKGKLLMRRTRLERHVVNGLRGVPAKLGRTGPK